MAKLTTQEIDDLAKEFMSWHSGLRTLFPNLTKADIVAAFDGADTLLDNNASALNNGIPTPARTELTTGLKNDVYTRVMNKRWGGSV